MIIYIAGPMTGLKGFNRESFKLAERALKARGYEVRNPACLPTDWSHYSHYISVGLVMLGQCDAIVYLPGSDKSAGVTVERGAADEQGLPDKTHLLLGIKPELNAEYLRAKGAAR